jgi:hypothetical protein
MQRLVEVLTLLGGLLREHSEVFWADWIAADATRTSRGDRYGLEHLLTAYGGMGSLNDVYFDPLNGNASTAPQAVSLNQTVGLLRSEAYALARGLQREFDGKG